MASAVWNRNGAGSRMLREADRILGFDLSAGLREDGNADLRRTVLAQPALLAVSYAMWIDAVEERGEPDDLVAVAGHSLGEFTALVVAGALSYADGLRLVQARGRFMGEACRERAGKMAAVIGLPLDRVAGVCMSASSPDSIVVVANYNSPTQIVISGDVAAVERASRTLEEAGARRIIPLNVEGGCHSPLMAPAPERFAETVEKTNMSRPRWPLVANVDGRILEQPAEIKVEIVAQLTSPVRWIDCVQTLRSIGADRFVETGPGEVLAGLIKRTSPDVVVATMYQPNGEWVKLWSAKAVA